LLQKVCSVRIRSWKACLGRNAEGRAAFVETVVVDIVGVLSGLSRGAIYALKGPCHA